MSGGQQVNVYRELRMASDAIFDPMPIGVYQDIFDAASSTQNYRLGQRKILEDGSVWVYAKAGGAINRTDLGVKNGLCQGVAQRAVAAAQSVGDKTATLTCASPDGASADGNIVLDEFKDGYILFFTTGAVASYDKQVRRVTGNTAGTTSIVFTFDRGLEIALATATSKAEVMASPYKHVVISSGANFPVVGIPAVLADSGEYLWLQTWGVTWISPQSTVGLVGNTGLVFRHDGSLEPITNESGVLTVPDGTYDTTQHAGFVMAETSASAQAAPFIMLQISP